MGNTYPPSSGSFSDNASAYINATTSFLVSTKAPLLANVYPYFAYISNPTDIKLDYALLNSSGVVVQDGNLGYQNLFDAMMDSLYSALEKIGAANLTVIVIEIGWPSDGGVAATVDNAGTYYKNLISHVNNGTTKRPRPLETYLFALFDEDQKGLAETEKNFEFSTSVDFSLLQIHRVGTIESKSCIYSHFYLSKPLIRKTIQ
nr:glucan endo-1,3-beta-glucosidase [Quercus suber]